MGYELRRGTNGEEGYYRLTLDLPLTADEVYQVADLAREGGWSFGDELLDEIDALVAETRYATFVHFLPPSEHDLIWRADGPFAPVTFGPAYGRLVDGKMPAILAELLDRNTGDDGQWDGADVCDAVASLAEPAFARCPVHGFYSAAKPRCPLCAREEARS